MNYDEGLEKLSFVSNCTREVIELDVKNSRPPSLSDILKFTFEPSDFTLNLTNTNLSLSWNLEFYFFSSEAREPTARFIFYWLR